MTDLATDKYSASEQGLGYIYQPRLALLRLLELPENTAVFLEKDDDLDFVDKDGSKSLGKKGAGYIFLKLYLAPFALHPGSGDCL